MIKKIIFLFSLVFFFSGCDNKDNDQQAGDIIEQLKVTDFVRLTDDSTKIAGVLEILSAFPQVELQWLASSGCNLDTLLTSIAVMDGKCILPICWDKRTNGSYGPSDKAFATGVRIIAGNASKYVQLIWADEVDSTYILKSPVYTRGDQVEPREVMLELYPDLVPMDKVTGNEVYVDFSGVSVATVDQTGILESTHILKSDIKAILTAPGSIPLKWTTEGSPDVNFSADLRVTARPITKIARINYTIPDAEPSFWLFESSTPENNNFLPAKQASVVVTAKTNKDWSIESDLGLISPVKDNGGTPLASKQLTISVKDNDTNTSRPITVRVYSQGILKETLTFTQSANTGGGGEDPGTSFTFVSSVPADRGNISATGGNVTVNVNTDYAWWIDLNGTKTNLPAGALGNKTGTIAIPANTGTTAKTITVTVGHGITTEKTLTFTQPANDGGGEDAGTSFTFVSSVPADRGNVSATGGNVTVNVNTDYAWWIDLNGVKTSLPAGALGDKTGLIAVPANTGTTVKTITVTVGHGTTTVKTLTFTQPANDGGGAEDNLVYSTSDLPTGNIPVAGKVYTFTFTGNYAGNLRIRAMNATTNEVLSNGPLGTTHTPKVTISANTATTTRNIKFQYRLIDITGSAWLNLPATTNRIQDAIGDGGIPGNITAGKILPPGDVPENGRSYYCVFKGTGKVIFRALRNKIEVSRSTEGTATAAGVNLGVTIPSLGTNKSSTISFEYSTDGGNTWINMNDDRAQKQTYVVVEPSTVQEFPARNASGSFGIRGTTSQIVTIYAYSGGLQIGKASTSPVEEGVMLNVPIQDNPGPGTRLVSFSWTLDGENWISTPPVKQLAP